MKAEELRIGNHIDICVSNQDYGLASIVSIMPPYAEITYSNGSADRRSIDNLKGIPLTEEWLERFGLEKIIYSFRGWRARDINKTFEVIGDELRMNSPLLNGPLTIHKGLRYVHQLQNLYFALTGEELTV